MLTRTFWKKVNFCKVGLLESKTPHCIETIDRAQILPKAGMKLCPKIMFSVSKISRWKHTPRFRHETRLETSLCYRNLNVSIDGIHRQTAHQTFDRFVVVLYNTKQRQKTPQHATRQHLPEISQHQQTLISAVAAVVMS